MVSVMLTPKFIRQSSTRCKTQMPPFLTLGGADPQPAERAQASLSDVEQLTFHHQDRFAGHMYAAFAHAGVHDARTPHVVTLVIL